jgi:hypothetical protein
MNTCKHCRKPIDRSKTTYWVHTSSNGFGYVKCDPKDINSKQAQPK